MGRFSDSNEFYTPKNEYGHDEPGILKEFDTPKESFHTPDEYYDTSEFGKEPEAIFRSEPADDEQPQKKTIGKKIKMLYFAAVTIVTVDAVGLSPVFGYSLGLHTEYETVTCETCRGSGIYCPGNPNFGYDRGNGAGMESCYGTGIIACPDINCHGGMYTCPECAGTGKNSDGTVCQSCNGRGVYPHEEFCMGTGYMACPNQDAHTVCPDCHGEKTVKVPKGTKVEKIQADLYDDTKKPESNTSAVTPVPDRPRPAPAVVQEDEPVPAVVQEDDDKILFPENKVDRKPATILVACDACGGHGFICYGEHVQGLFVPEYIESCHGTGIIPCPYTICHGGMATCTICNGSGTEVCHGCNGSGIESHHGGGYVYDANGNTSTCHYCNGSGRITCQYCGGRGSSVCEKCGGTGFAPCKAPHVTCEKCNGTGLMEEKVSATEKEF